MIFCQILLIFVALFRIKNHITGEGQRKYLRLVDSRMKLHFSVFTVLGFSYVVELVLYGAFR